MMGVFPKFINGDFQFSREEKLFGMPVVLDETTPKEETHIKDGNKILAILEDESSKEENE